MTNQLITHRLPIDYSLISLMSMISSISYAWHACMLMTAHLCGVLCVFPHRILSIREIAHSLHESIQDMHN